MRLGPEEETFFLIGTTKPTSTNAPVDSKRQGTALQVLGPPKRLVTRPPTQEAKPDILGGAPESVVAETKRPVAHQFSPGGVADAPVAKPERVVAAPDAPVALPFSVVEQTNSQGGTPHGVEAGTTEVGGDAVVRISETESREETAELPQMGLSVSIRLIGDQASPIHGTAPAAALITAPIILARESSAKVACIALNFPNTP
jgi:hypothetical protein